MLSLLVYVVRKTLNEAFFARSRAEAEKRVLHVQGCHNFARAARFLVVLLIKPVASLTLPFAVVGLFLKRSIDDFKTVYNTSGLVLKKTGLVSKFLVI